MVSVSDYRDYPYSTLAAVEPQVLQLVAVETAQVPGAAETGPMKRLARPQQQVAAANTKSR